MQKLSQLSDAKLHTHTLNHTNRLRHCQADLFESLAENLRRKLYLQHACSNLTRYIEVKLGVPNGTAYRYALAAQTVLEFPESATALRAGRLSLEGMVESRRLFREREKASKAKPSPSLQPQMVKREAPKPIPKREQRKILQSLENKSSQEIRRGLAEHRSGPLPQKPRVKEIRGGRTELTLSLTSEEMQVLERLREVMGQTKCWKEVILGAADDSLDKRDPARREERRVKRQRRKERCTMNDHAARSTESQLKLPSETDESMAQAKLQNEATAAPAQAKLQNEATAAPAQAKLQNEATAAPAQAKLQNEATAAPAQAKLQNEATAAPAQAKLQNEATAAPAQAKLQNEATAAPAQAKLQNEATAAPAQAKLQNEATAAPAQAKLQNEATAAPAQAKLQNEATAAPAQAKLQNEATAAPAQAKLQNEATAAPAQAKLQNEGSNSLETIRIPISTVQADREKMRAGQQCEHVSSDGKRCTSRSHLDIDHILPASQGGTNDPSNLRVLCAAHNRNRGFWDPTVE
jgi:hypothetical protein